MNATVGIPKRVRHKATGRLHTVLAIRRCEPDREIITWSDPSPDDRVGGDSWMGPLTRFQVEFEALA